MTRLGPHTRCKYIRLSVHLLVLNRILYTHSSLKYRSDKHIQHPTLSSSTSGLRIPTSISGIRCCNSSWPSESLVSLHILGSLAAVGFTYVIAASCWSNAEFHLHTSVAPSSVTFSGCCPLCGRPSSSTASSFCCRSSPSRWHTPSPSLCHILYQCDVPLLK